MNQTLIKKNKRLIAILFAAATVLAIPLIATQFTQEVNWNLSDFLIMGILLFGTALVCEFILRKVQSTKARILMCAAALLILFLIWAELAVGIFGTPFAGS